MAHIICICFIIVILGIAYRLLLELQEWICDIKRRRKRNQFDKYKVYEIQLKQDKESNSNYENWYYAKVAILYIFGLIPVYTKFICNKADFDLRFWKNKEALLHELKISAKYYSAVKKEKELKRTKGKRIS